MTAAPKHRILLVDDSAVVCRLVREILSGDPALEVVATASNGRKALDRLEECLPDIVVLDVEMPVMDGLETLARMRRRYPNLPVIMFSVVTERGAAATLDALALGALDYVTKPSQGAGLDEARRFVLEQLGGKIKAILSRDRCARVPRVAPRPSGPARPKLVAVGASTGGPEALTKLIGGLPADFALPILVAQHMPPLFVRHFRRRLAGRTGLAVRLAAHGDEIEQRHVYLAPGDHHMAVARDGDRLALRVWQGPAENSCRPSVDVLFRSAAQHYGPGALGIVLTGMGRDGLLGSREIVRRGGAILAQDRETSVVWGMPGLVADEGLAQEILPAERLAKELAARAALPDEAEVS